MSIDQKYMFDGKEGLEYTNPYYSLGKYNRGLDDVGRIILHCTATDSKKWNDPLSCINFDLNPNHISRHGCPFATYHFYIAKDGSTYQLVSMNYRTWNCKGNNRDTVAICINHGGYPNDEPVTEEQINSIIKTVAHIFDVLDWGYDKYGVEERIFFHRDFANKLCPGQITKEDILAKIVNFLNGRVPKASAINGNNVKTQYSASRSQNI